MGLMAYMQEICYPDDLHLRNKFQAFLFNAVGRLTCAHKSGRVWVPPPIWFTHCSCQPFWNKSRVTSEEYHSSLSFVYETIYWDSRVTAVTSWRE